MTAPCRFLFTDYNRLSSVGGETSMAEMIATLSDACEREFGFLATRLFRVFKTEETQGECHTHTFPERSCALVLIPAPTLREEEVEEDVLRPVLHHLRPGADLRGHRHGAAGHLQGGWEEPDRQRGSDRHQQRGGSGSAAELQDVVAGDRLGAELATQAAARRRQQDAQAEERGLHEGEKPENLSASRRPE